MAQIGVQQPSNLMDMFSSPSPMLWDIAANQVNQQSQGNTINQNSAIQDQQIAQQKLPFELQQLDLNNQMTGAQIPGQQAISSLNQDKANISRNTMPNQLQAQISDLASKVSKDHLDEAENAVKTALTDPSANVRATAAEQWQNLSAIKAEKMKQDEEYRRAIDVANINGKTQRDVMQSSIDAGRYVKAFNSSVDLQIRAAKNPEEKLLKIQSAFANTTDPSEQAHYRDLYAETKPMYDNYMAAKTASNAGKPSATALTGMEGVPQPTAPEQLGSTPNAAPSNAKRKSPDQYQQWHDRAKQLNPNLSDQEILQEAKRLGYQ